MHSNLYHLHILWPLVQQGCCGGALRMPFVPYVTQRGISIILTDADAGGKMHTLASNGHTKLIIMSFRWKYNIYKIRPPTPPDWKTDGNLWPEPNYLFFSLIWFICFGNEDGKTICMEGAWESEVLIVFPNGPKEIWLMLQFVFVSCADR